MKKIDILYENDEILIINKPAGLATQGGEGVAHSVDSELSKQVGYKIYLVHRLDKETFGLMVVAKNSAAASKWISLISGKQVKKEYKALCFNLPSDEKKILHEGVIRDFVKKGDRELSAETHFKVEKSAKVSLPSTDATDSTAQEKADSLTLSLLHLKLGTGRMHQIRIHLAKYGCPIAGDDKHGNFKLNKLARKIGIKSLQLCSFKLTLPLEKKDMSFEIKLPDSMIQFFEDDFRKQ